MLSNGLAEAVSVALAAAQWTGGRTDPTVGDALISLGYDRDFAAIDPERREPHGSPAPAPGWRMVRLDGPILVADGPDPAGSAAAQLVRLPGGAVATSSITCRQWRRAGRVLHHIVDPRTGLPAHGPWQTVSVAAATCADANAAATAAIVAGGRGGAWVGSGGLAPR